jgi:hypothetical protein
MPQKQSGPNDLEDLLDRLDEAASEGAQVSLDEVLDAVGRRSFGPIVLLAGLVILMPLVGDIPGVPTLMGVFVVLSVGQLLFGRDRVWLPKWLLKRSVGSDRFRKAIGWIRKPAGAVDRVIRPRLLPVVRGPGRFVIAVSCLITSAATPAMEVVPFSANGAGAALTAFGLALIAEDGLLALLAMIFTSGTFVLVLYNIL